MKKKSTRTLRVIIPLAIIVVVGIGFAAHAGFGTLSDFGWQDISLICPMGALSTMLASKLLVPKALISLAVAAVAIILLGRVFCGWICPVPVVSKLREVFARRKPAENVKPDDELSADEKAALKTSCSGSCSTCAEKRGAVDSRHLVLGGGLLSAAIFGFPVFCLVCPIGLTFASVLLLIRAFGVGDVSWSLIAVPALLLVEVVFFRKWCSKFCPLSALMSLVGHANKTFKPSIDDSKCLETSKGRTCEVCSKVCNEGINPRRPQLGASQMNECTRCRECIEHCPAGAISMPFLAKKGMDPKDAAPESTEKAA